jgi:serine/threonine-protein phosphatase 5
MVIKSIGGQQVLDWDFVDIMDLWDDYDFEPTDDARAKKAWLERDRKHQAAALPLTVEFQECKVTEIDEDAPVQKIAGKWYPRPGGYTDAELDAELARVKKESPVPADYKGVVYSGPSCLDEAWIKGLMEQQKAGVLMPISMAYHLVIDAIKALKKGKTLGQVNIPPGGKVTVVGDTHGQYWDVMNIYAMNGLPSKDNPYIFNGDLVDRGSWGMENILLAFAMKVKDPEYVSINRGNHELIEANMMYGFTGECFKKYDRELFNLFSEAFRQLSLCHLINKDILVVHGGIPGPNPRIFVPGMSHDPNDAIPLNKVTLTLDEIAAVDREFELQSSSYKNAVEVDLDENAQPIKVSGERICIDCIWGDPRGTSGYGPSYRKSRGVFMYGPDVTAKFCEHNGLKYVIRSHEVKEDGWKQDHPNLYTVFSAPDYMDTGGNKGAIISITNEGGELKITPIEFGKTPHPELPPMIWQDYFLEDCPHLTKKMKKKTGPVYDSNGMLVQLSKAEMEDRANQWVEDDDEGDIDGVAPGNTLQQKMSS